jgi:hypothetical protein
MNCGGGSDVRIFAVASSASAPAECAGHVIVSGSYGGEYNAWHAAKHGIRGVVLNDAGVGHDAAGIKGLSYLDRIGLPAVTADVMSCHIGDGEHMLEHGIISYVNQSASALGFGPGDRVKRVAEGMRHASIVTTTPPSIQGGKKREITRLPNGLRLICVDAAPMIDESDAGAIAVTGSHAALFRGKPDDVIRPQLTAVFFSDGGVGLDGAGVSRLPVLDERGIIAGAVSATSASIGDSLSIYEDGVLYHLNQSALAAGGAIGMRLKTFVAKLLDQASKLKG